MNAMQRGAVAVPVRPLSESGKELIGIRGLLEWAFGIEHAQLDYDELRDAGFVRAWAARSQTANICDMLAIGKQGRSGVGVKVDVSGGRSYPHDDADLVAGFVRLALPWRQAVAVAEYARAGRVPQWDLGAPRLVPRAWGKKNHKGQFGKTEVCQVVRYVVRGRERERKELWTPCRWSPSHAEIAAARRGYLEWWSALLSVQCALAAADLRRFELTNRMPVMCPWERVCEKKV